MTENEIGTKISVRIVGEGLISRRCEGELSLLTGDIPIHSCPRQVFAQRRRNAEKRFCRGNVKRGHKLESTNIEGLSLEIEKSRLVSGIFLHFLCVPAPLRELIWTAMIPIDDFRHHGHRVGTRGNGNFHRKGVVTQSLHCFACGSNRAGFIKLPTKEHAIPRADILKLIEFGESFAPKVRKLQ